nr:MAG TPA: hypothetical protein [Caudoviricetes sp.]
MRLRRSVPVFFNARRSILMFHNQKPTRRWAFLVLVIKILRRSYCT